MKHPLSRWAGLVPACVLTALPALTASFPAVASPVAASAAVAAESPAVAAESPAVAAESPAVERALPHLKFVCPVAIGDHAFAGTVLGGPSREQCVYADGHGSSFAIGASWVAQPAEPGDTTAACVDAGRTSWHWVGSSSSVLARFGTGHRAHAYVYLNLSAPTAEKLARQKALQDESQALGDNMLTVVEGLAQPCLSVAPAGSSSRPLPARVVSVTGDVEFSAGDDRPLRPLTAGTELFEGFAVSTGSGARAELEFPHATLVVTSKTRLRLDVVTRVDTLERTQLFLQAGTVGARLRSGDAVSSDVTVSTVSGTASIRGSEMIVSVADGVSTVFTVEDASFARGMADTAELRVPQGYMTRIGPDHRATAPTAFAPQDLPQLTPEAESARRPLAGRLRMPLLAAAGAVVAAAVLAVPIMLRRRTT